MFGGLGESYKPLSVPGTTRIRIRSLGGRQLIFSKGLRGQETDGSRMFAVYAATM